jgi:hypothetical protein
VRELIGPSSPSEFEAQATEFVPSFDTGAVSRGNPESGNRNDDVSRFPKVETKKGLMSPANLRFQLRRSTVHQPTTDNMGHALSRQTLNQCFFIPEPELTEKNLPDQTGKWSSDQISFMLTD